MAGTTALVGIVDDEESVRRALGRLLRSAGFSVEAYGSGADFLRAAEQRPPDVVVLDLRMPHVSGLDVLRALRRADVMVPVVVITGDDSPESRAQALDHGAWAYLRKPVDDAMLLDAITTALRDGVAPTRSHAAGDSPRSS